MHSSKVYDSLDKGNTLVTERNQWLLDGEGG